MLGKQNLGNFNIAKEDHHPQKKLYDLRLPSKDIYF